MTVGAISTHRLQNNGSYNFSGASSQTNAVKGLTDQGISATNTKEVKKLPNGFTEEVITTFKKTGGNVSIPNKLRAKALKSLMGNHTATGMSGKFVVPKNPTIITKSTLTRIVNNKGKAVDEKNNVERHVLTPDGDMIFLGNIKAEAPSAVNPRKSTGFSPTQMNHSRAPVPRRGRTR